MKFLVQKNRAHHPNAFEENDTISFEVEPDVKVMNKIYKFVTDYSAEFGKPCLGVTVPFSEYFKLYAYLNSKKELLTKAKDTEIVLFGVPIYPVNGPMYSVLYSHNNAVTEEYKRRKGLK